METSQVAVLERPRSKFLDHASVFFKALVRPKPATLILSLCMFASGMSGYMAESVIGSVGTYIMGNSIKQFTMIMATMMLMMGVAGGFQKRIRDGYLVAKFISLEMLLALITGYSSVIIFWAYGNLDAGYGIVYYGVACLIGLLIGLEIPLVLRINEKFMAILAANFAWTVSFDYFGSFFGAVAFNSMMDRGVNLSTIPFVAGSINYFPAVFLFGYAWKKNKLESKVSPYVLMVIILITVSLKVYGFVHAKDWAISSEQKLYEDRIEDTLTTVYQHMVRTYDPSIDRRNIFLNGNIQFAAGKGGDEERYHESLVHPAMQLITDHRKVLIIGGGDGCALREVLKYSDVEEVHLVDLDHEWVKYCANDSVMRMINHDAFMDARVTILPTNGVVPDSVMWEPIFMETDQIGKNGKPQIEVAAKVRVMNVDAAQFIRNAAEQYNVIIMDLVDSSTPELAGLYTLDYFKNLRKKLAVNGAFVIQSTSPYHAPKSFSCIRWTLEAAGFHTFPYHENVPSFGDWGFILCVNSRLSFDATLLRIEAITKKQEFDGGIELRYLTPARFGGQLTFGKGMLLPREEIKINRLFERELFRYYRNEDWKID